MLIYASCAARDGAGVLLTGPAGSGKSDLLLRLIERGFSLVADDQVDVDDGLASPPPALAGLIEVRGLGILRMSHLAYVRLALSVSIGRGERMPMPSRDRHDLPCIQVDPLCPSAAQRIALALECALGRQTMLAGAFAAC